jgi:glycerol-3-phosphate dehydrogenase (NAD(P)+)
VLRRLGDGKDAAVLWLCKGFQEGTGWLGHEIAQAAMPSARVGVLSGPSFAIEVARGQPTALVAASRDEALGEAAVAAFHAGSLRIYTSADPIGVEVGGAVKNVLAIGCGVVDGKGLGQNARAALISRGFAEMTRFGLAKGARPETLAGLAGLGDLVLTCSSTSSRNFSLGKGIGEGRRPADLLADRRTVAEGAATAPVLKRVADALGVDMPIVAAVDALLKEEVSVDEAVGRLLARPLRSEGV